MWHHFYYKKEDLIDLLDVLKKWQNHVFKIQTEEIKKYFAKKMVVYFDNKMIFNAKEGLHNNLIYALSESEKEMNNVDKLFPSIKAFIIKENIGYSVLIASENKLINFNILLEHTEKFNLDSLLKVKLLEMKKNALEMLIFDFNLVNYAQNWIQFTPGLKQRSELQAKYVLMQKILKKNDMSILEETEIEKNIENHQQYQELLEKIQKFIPKMELVLEKEIKEKEEKIKLTK